MGRFTPLAFACLTYLFLPLAALAANKYPPGPGGAFPDTLGIYQVQNTAAIPHPAALDTVLGVGGIIIGFDSITTAYGFYIESSMGTEFTGVDVFTGAFNFQSLYGLAIGDSVVVYGRTQEFGGGTEIEGFDGMQGTNDLGIRRVSTGNPLPPAFVGTTTQLKEPATNTFAEKYEGMLVRVNPTGAGTFTVARTSLTGGLGTSNSFLAVDSAAPGDSVFVDGSTLFVLPPPAVGSVIGFLQGVFDQRSRGYRVQLRSGNDLEVAAPPSVTDAYPVTDTRIRLTFDRSVTAATGTNTANYSLSSLGSVDAATMDGQDAVLLDITNGLPHGVLETVTVNGIGGLGNGLVMTTGQSKTFVNGVLSCAEIQTPDPDSLAGSPCRDRSRFAGGGGRTGEGLLGPRLTMTGVATGVFTPLNYLEDQGGGLRSGVSVFAPPTAMVVGHKYRVVGNVEEFSSETEVSGVLEAYDLGPVSPVAALDVAVGDAARDTCDAAQALTDGEDYEGVLVRLSNVEVVQRVTPLPTTGFHVAGESPAFPDTIFVSNLNGALSPFSYPALGERYSITGVLHYTNNSFSICPRSYGDIATAIGPGEWSGRTKALILFDDASRAFGLMHGVRKQIEASGGRVRAVLGLAALVADLEPGSVSDLARTTGVQGVYDTVIVAPPFTDAQTVWAVAAWNRLLGPPPAPAAEHPNPPPTDAYPAPDLPPAVAAPQSVVPEQVNRPRAPGARTNSNGAGFYATSLYLAGDVAVGVFYTTTGWTPALTTSEFADVVYSLDQYLGLESSARIVFTYMNEVDNAGNPLPKPSDERQFDNDLRDTWGTDWAYLIEIRNDATWPNAYINGPSLRLDRSWSPYFVVAAHETGHIFGAGDEYCSGQYPNIPSRRYGYLQATHGNACDSDGSGYFSGAGEGLPDLMSGWDPCYSYNWLVGPFTAGEFGWYDHNGNGTLDVMETQPVIDAASVSHTAGNPPTYGGVAVERPLLDGLDPAYGSVSINRITGVQYRINGLAWQDATAADGVFDSASEGFQFTAPALPNGTYQVEIRATNTIGKSTVLPFSQSLVITGSSTTNTRPFGVLSVTPARARFGTVVTAVGSASRDVETPTNQLQYSWDWGTGFSAYAFTSTSSHVYSTAGTYVVQMRVRDASGLFHLVTRSVVVESYNTAPVVVFHATPEDRHGTSGPSYPVTLSIVGTTDGETPFSSLEARWDADGDGTYEYPWSTLKTRTVTLPGLQLKYPATSVCVPLSIYPRSDHRIVRVQVRDPEGNVSTAERAIWVVPYNHRPTVPFVNGVTTDPTHLTATAHASDADHSTTWDGLLEYRWDFDGDGIWDTQFEPNATTTVPSLASFNTLVVEIQDRFQARVSSELWHWPLVADRNPSSFQVLVGAPVSFDVENTGDATGQLTYAITVMAPDMTPDTAVVRLNGLPPCTPVQGVLDLPIGQSTTINVDVEFDRQVPAASYVLLVTGDKNHDGVVSEVMTSQEIHLEGPAVNAVGGEVARWTLSLEGAHPNPTVGAARVWFTLPSWEPATLEVVDIAGRRLLRQDVGALGPGRHSVETAAAIHAPGLYFLRLEQGGQALKGKMAIVR